MKLKKSYLSILIILTFSLHAYSQSDTCSNVLPFCSDTGVNFENTTGTFTSEVGPNYGCLEAQPNPTWFYFKVGQDGNLNLRIEQNSAADFSGFGIDVDYICYGPFSEAEFLTGVCDNLTFLNTVDCSYSWDSIETLNIIGAKKNDYYILLITNFDNLPGYIKMNQTNLTNPNVGATDCSILETALGPDQNVCVGTPVNLDATPTEGVAISYDWFIDIGLGFNPIPSQNNAILSVLTSGIYKVEITNIDGAIATDEVEIIISEIPIATQPLPIIVCDDDNNGTMPFNLTLQNNFINSTPGMLITYHSSQAFADDGSNPLPNPFESGTKTIYVRVENSANSNCFDTTNFEIRVFETPTPSTTLTNLSQCDSNFTGTDTDGIEIFDLTDKESEILSGQSATDFTIYYYTDAALTNQIPNPTTFQNTLTSQTIYVKMFNNLNSSCVALTNFNIEVFELPTVLTSVSLKQCDDNNDGFSSFNLTEVTAKISSNSTNETFTYFKTSIAADINDSTQEILSPITYTNSTINTETVWTRVENNNSCHRVSEINLIVSTTLIPDTFQKIFFECDDFIDVLNDETDGITTFNFSSVTAEINAIFPIGQQLFINYYRNETDALAEQNPIIDTSNYRNIGYPNTQTIYVRVDSQLNNDCLGLGAHITLNVEPIPIANNASINKECDDDFDGFFPFDTSTIEATILNGQTNVTVTYFDQNNNTLPSPLPNPFLINSQIIRIRVTDNNSVDPDGSCFAETTLEFIVEKKPIANLVPNIVTCDDDFDGLFSFDTSTIETTVLNGQTGMLVFYFDQNGNSLPSPLPNPFLTETQTITIRVENELYSNCTAETTFDFIVNPKPQFELDDTAIYCTNLPPITIETYNPLGVYTYEWKDENGIMVSTNFDAVISSEGVYTVIATSNEGCESLPHQIIIEASSIALLTENDITVVDDSDNNSITIAKANLGIGDYEYALVKSDEFISSFQDDPYFDYLAPGIYTIFIQDRNDCGIAQMDVSIIGFPRFFTPNNDGFNDTWKIIGVNENFYASSNIFIFDRFGKFITQINPKGDGWDGLFKGNPLPATDYWFSVELVDNIGNIRTRKGHFSLIRK